MSVVIVDREVRRGPLQLLDAVGSDVRRMELAVVRTGYLVTGGGREPYYGCIDCIPRAGEVSPAHWQLLKEFPGPATPTPWRFEPIRVWEAKEVSDGHPSDAPPTPVP